MSNAFTVPPAQIRPIITNVTNNRQAYSNNAPVTTATAAGKFNIFYLHNFEGGTSGGSLFMLNSEDSITFATTGGSETTQVVYPFEGNGIVTQIAASETRYSLGGAFPAIYLPEGHFIDTVSGPNAITISYTLVEYTFDA